MWKEQLGVEIGRRITEVAMSALRIFLALVWFPVSAVAATDARSLVDFVAEIAEARLMLAEHILRSSADFVAANPSIEASQGHAGLSAILNNAAPFRSILALDENGHLEYDSFNPVKFLGAVDLSERDYFRSTSNSAAMRMIVNGPIVAKQSGRMTLPLTMAVPNDRGRFQKVVALMADPDAFLPHVDVCSFCGVVLVKDGGVLASNQLMSEVNAAIVGRMSFSGRYGASEVDVRGMNVSVHWRRSEMADLVFVFYEASPKRE